MYNDILKYEIGTFKDCHINSNKFSGYLTIHIFSLAMVCKKLKLYSVNYLYCDNIAVCH